MAGMASKPRLPSSLKASDSVVSLGWNNFEAPVIPAKAGIQSVGRAFPKACGVDSRFRGNDCGLGRPSGANGTTTLRFAPCLCAQNLCYTLRMVFHGQ